MGKVTERDIAAFAVEFVNKICEINESLIMNEGTGYRLIWGSNEITLYDIYSGELTADGVLENCWPAEMSVNEFTENSACIAYLICSGDLYEKMYYYESMGDGGEEAKKLCFAADLTAEKYGMYFDWAGGALTFYEIDND